MSDLLDDFIAFLEQDDNPPHDDTTAPVEEYDDLDIPITGDGGDVTDLPTEWVDFSGNTDAALKGESAVPKKGFALGAVKSKQQVYKSNKLPYGGSHNEPGGENDCGATIEFLNMRITRAAVTAETMNNLTSGKRVIKLTEIPFSVDRVKKEIDGDWITGGIVIDRRSLSSKKTGELFTIMKLSDLRDTSKYVSLFLFGDVHSAFENLSVASVIGLLNPCLMPSQQQEDGKSGRKTGNNKKKQNEEICALRLDHKLKLLQLGYSQDFGRCRAELPDGDICHAVINKSHALTCIFHTNREYRKVVTARPDLKATYSGIIPNSDSVEIQQSVVDNNFALLGPSGISSKAKLKVKAQMEKSIADQPEVLDQTAVSKESLESLSEAELKARLAAHKQAKMEKRERLKREFDLRKQLEAEMIADAVSKPLTLAARNLAKLHQVQKNGVVPIKSQAEDGDGVTPLLIQNKKKKQSEGSRVNLSHFAAAEEIFSKMKPIRPEITASARPQLGRGCDPGSNVFLDVDEAATKKKAHLLPRRKLNKQPTVTPFDIMNVRKKTKSDTGQPVLSRAHEDDDVQIICKGKSPPHPLLPKRLRNPEVNETKNEVPKNPSPRPPVVAAVPKPVNASKKRKLDAIASRVQGSLNAPDDAI